MIRILTDSASDLTATDSARPGVYTVPLSVTFADGTGGLDGVELTADEFYAHLKVDKVPPRTSQPSPQSFMTIFEDAKENGDQVIAILISSNLSGTYQCARLAAESCDFEDVFFVDSRTASQGEAILVREALRLRDEEHLPAHAIVAELEQLKQRIRVLAVVDSLKHLHKGGRLPAAVALVGGALGVKPVLSVVDGQIKLADTARGRPGAFVAMFKNIEKMGNKQKVVFGKWCADDADVLILDCPTRGVDIGVKAAMYQLIYDMKKQGKSIIMISEELPELMGMCDRLLIMRDGAVSGEFYRKDGYNDRELIERMI